MTTVGAPTPGAASRSRSRSGTARTSSPRRCSRTWSPSSISRTRRSGRREHGGGVADQMLQKVTAGLAAGNYPDIAYIFGSDVANLAAQPAPRSHRRVRERGLELGRLRRPGRPRSPSTVGRARCRRSSTTSPSSTTRSSSTRRACRSRGRLDVERFPATTAKLTTPGPESSAPAGPGPATRTRRGGSGRWCGSRAATSSRGRQVGRLRRAQRPGGSRVVAKASSTARSTSTSPPAASRCTALHQRQDGDGPPARGRCPRTSTPRSTTASADADLRRRARDDLGPGHVDGARQRRRRTAAAIEFVKWLSQPAQEVRWTSEAGSLPLPSDVEQPGGQRVQSPPGMKFVERARPARVRRSRRTRRSPRRWASRSSRCCWASRAEDALSQAVDAANGELHMPGS